MAECPKKRVVVTGLGAITPLGNTVDELWDGIKSGRNGVGFITIIGCDDLNVKIAAEVKNFDPTLYMETKDARKMARYSQYAVAGSVMAVKDAGLDNGSWDPQRTGVVLGNGIGGFEILEDAYFRLWEKGPSRIPPLTIPKLISNEGPGNVAIRLDAQGPCYTITTACASGTDAIGNSLRMIQTGSVDIVITGGTEGCITKMGIAGFTVLKALSTKYNDSPAIASRPFDKDRDGFVVGEGSGILVLEELEHAKARGAHIYAEVIGYGITCDADHITAPHPEGRGAAQAMVNAMQDAGIGPDDVDYINAHGTSTPTNDPIETKAIKTAFGERAYSLKVSSTKSMTGHCIGGAGGIEAIISIKAINEGIFPPTINLDEPDPACDLDYVPNEAQKGEIEIAMSDSLGFGGHNGVIIFKRYST
jgi:3-oxoacyl-[acyl-carrier-protein] synthase II